MVLSLSWYASLVRLDRVFRKQSRFQVQERLDTVQCVNVRVLSLIFPDRFQIEVLTSFGTADTPTLSLISSSPNIRREAAFGGAQ